MHGAFIVFSNKFSELVHFYNMWGFLCLFNIDIFMSDSELFILSACARISFRPFNKVVYVSLHGKRSKLNAQLVFCSFHLSLRRLDL